MNILGMVLMMLVFVGILFGGHFFIYFSLVRFLHVESNNIRMWLAAVLFLLSIGFIAASLMAHYSENVITRTGYFLTSMWLAVGWNLILALILSWAIVGIANFLGWSFEHRYLALGSLLFIFFFSSYGIWAAYHPIIKNITVEIKNLPPQWKNKKAVQLSDVHLGHIYGKQFLAGIVSQVNAQQPDLIFITGDLFDGMDGQLDALISPLNDIRTADGTYFVTGNHETYLGVKDSVAVLKKTPVQVLDNDVVNIDGMQILGISYPERGAKDDFAGSVENIKNFDVQKPNILLYHNPIVADLARDLGIDLQLAGHTHRGQLFPFQWITGAIYGKYHSGLSTEGNFSIYTSSGVGTWGPTMRTSGRPEIVVITFR